MLSKKTQYALKALSYMVEHNNGAPILIATIAEEKNIPIKFLENILLAFCACNCFHPPTSSNLIAGAP